MHSANNCPNCGVFLEKPPRRKSSCPHCGKLILVRNKELVSEDRANEIDAIKKLDMFGVDEDRFAKERRHLTEKFGKKTSVGDTVWSIYNGLLGEGMKKSDFQGLSNIYYNMALHLSGEGRQGYKKILETAQRMNVLSYKNSGFVTKVKTQTVNDNFVCASCSEFSKKPHAIEDVIEKSDYPAISCTSTFNEHSPGFCRCWFIPILHD
jgi:hypothetical protein